MIVVTFQTVISAAWFRCYRTFRYVRVVLISLFVGVSIKPNWYADRHHTEICVYQYYSKLFYVCFISYIISKLTILSRMTKKDAGKQSKNTDGKNSKYLLNIRISKFSKGISYLKWKYADIKHAHSCRCVSDEAFFYLYLDGFKRITGNVRIT